MARGGTNSFTQLSSHIFALLSVCICAMGKCVFTFVYIYIYTYMYFSKGGMAEGSGNSFTQVFFSLHTQSVLPALPPHLFTFLTVSISLFKENKQVSKIIMSCSSLIYCSVEILPDPSFHTLIKQPSFPIVISRCISPLHAPIPTFSHLLQVHDLCGN